MAHDHNHSHAEIQHLNTIFAIAVTLTLSYTVLETFYAAISHSMSLFADALHNFADILGLLFAWLANWLHGLPPQKRYSYGFKKSTIIASLANACFLIASSAVIIFESLQKLWEYHPVDPHIVVWIGLLGIAVNFSSSLLFLKGAKEDINLKGAFWHLLSDALILLGIVISALMISYTGWRWLDPIISISIIAIVLIGTWGLLRNSVILILDAVPHSIDQNSVLNYLKTLPGVDSLHDLHIWGLSTREIALTVHLIMPVKTLSDQELCKITADLYKFFKIHHVTIQLETGTGPELCTKLSSC